MCDEEKTKEYDAEAESYEMPQGKGRKRSRLLIRAAALITLTIFIVYSFPDLSFFISQRFNFISENGSLVKDEIVKNCRPGVVYVEAVDTNGNAKQGTGFNISSEGVIITNKHVIRDAAVVTVKFSDGRKFYSKDFTLDNDNDIGVVRIKGNDLPLININNENDPKKGDTVTVIGNPLGYSRISQRGSIGDVVFDTGNFAPVYEINIKVNPGNSGSPVIDSSSKVVGIVFASMDNKALAISARYIKVEKIKGSEGNGR